MNNSLAVPNHGPVADRALSVPSGRAARPGPADLFGEPNPRLSRPSCGSSITGAGWSSARSSSAWSGAILVTLLTTPVYRAWVTLEANPPTVSVSDEQSREQRSAGSYNPYDFVATQVGLLSSKSVAQRTAQELNLANNPDVVPQDLRCLAAAASGDRRSIAAGSRSSRPKKGS